MDWVAKDAETALHPVVHARRWARTTCPSSTRLDARARDRGAARRGRVGVPVRHERQHLRADDDDGGEVRRPHPRQHPARRPSTRRSTGTARRTWRRRRRRLFLASAAVGRRPARPPPHRGAPRGRLGEEGVGAGVAGRRRRAAAVRRAGRLPDAPRPFRPGRRRELSLDEKSPLSADNSSRDASADPVPSVRRFTGLGPTRATARLAPRARAEIRPHSADAELRARK